MNKYLHGDRISFVENYHKCDGNVTETLRKWSSQFKNRSKPSHSTVENLIEKFEKTGSVHDDFEDQKNNPKPSRSPEILEEVKKIMEVEPTISTRRLLRYILLSQHLTTA